MCCYSFHFQITGYSKHSVDRLTVDQSSQVPCYEKLSVLLIPRPTLTELQFTKEKIFPPSTEQNSCTFKYLGDQSLAISKISALSLDTGAKKKEKGKISHAATKINFL